ncbi:TIGR00282 family metallophosphoesterase [Candidatus Peregrinibacteria bacterium]|nr:TIGR00282 family metallophosphoesterase [Candidatus Peregrinibacteria bacterium]
MIWFDPSFFLAEMNILFIGDIYGKAGRNLLAKNLENIKKELNIDFVIANAENARHGKGVKKEHINGFIDAGVDFFTLGNHAFNDDEFTEKHLDEPNLPVIRPANFDSSMPGRGFAIVEFNGVTILIINLIGQISMKHEVKNPFKLVDKILGSQKYDISLVDFHAEATAEKAALGHYLDGRVTAVLGTHTHVQTNDARILSEGTAFITDAGMTGPHDSIIGADKDPIINFFVNEEAKHVTPATGPVQFNGVKIGVDLKSKKAKFIEPVNIIYE